MNLALVVIVVLAGLVTDATATATRSLLMPCDPALGFPVASAGCPEPATGWLRLGEEGGFVLQPIRTFGNGRRGRAYAARHDLEFPYSSDYLDVASGPPVPVALDAQTICTGSILVDFAGGLEDHRVDCAAFVTALRVRTPEVTVAVWRRHGRVVQLSELYRP